jgi:hypothetical protein
MSSSITDSCGSTERGGRPIDFTTHLESSERIRSITIINMSYREDGEGNGRIVFDHLVGGGSRACSPFGLGYSSSAFASPWIGCDVTYTVHFTVLGRLKTLVIPAS